MKRRELVKIWHSKSKTFLTFCFCFLAGIVIASIYNQRIDFLWVYIGLFLFLSLFILFWEKRSFLFTICGLLFMFIGFFRYSLALPKHFDPPTGEHVFTAFVAAEPDIRKDSVRYILKIMSNPSRQGFAEEGQQLTMTKDNIYVISTLYPRYAYGDVLEVECRLQRPEAFDGFRYDMYLLRFGVTLVCWNPEVAKVGVGEGINVIRYILHTKQIIAEHVNMLWHEP